MKFIYASGFVVLRDVGKVFPVSSCSFARKTTGRNQARSHSGACCGLKTKWDLKLSLPSPTYLIRYLFIEVGKTTPKLKLDATSSDSSGAWIFSHFRIQMGSADECVASGGGGGAPAPRDSLNFRRASLLSTRIWKWDFYHCSLCNFFFRICFCHLWRELPL